jgi:hypothetical protein
VSHFVKDVMAKLLALSSKEKRDRLEERIVTLLGGDPKKVVSHLPRRRGASDGGIDGRIRVVRVAQGSATATNPGGNPSAELEVEAAINVRVRKTPFSRDNIGAFINDMDRESLSVGIIVTASGLSPDADAELKRHNARGLITLVHLPLQDIISDQINTPSLRFPGGDLSATIRLNLQQFIEGDSSESRSGGRS